METTTRKALSLEALAKHQEYSSTYLDGYEEWSKR